MRKDEWLLANSSEWISGVPTAKHKITDETCLFGNKGEVYLSGPNVIKVILYKPEYHKVYAVALSRLPSVLRDIEYLPFEDRVLRLANFSWTR